MLHLKDCLTPNWSAPKNVIAVTTLKTTAADFTHSLVSTPKWLKQMHGTHVVCADDEFVIRPEADASYAREKNSICVVSTADCLPIVLCDKDGTQVAAMHAGWRGLAAGIIKATTQKFSAPQNCLAWIGPAIGAQAFEVGKDVPDTFQANNWPAEILASAFPAKPNTPGKYLGDLCALARFALQQQGILVANIFGGEFCTYSDPERFHSYRRSGLKHGMSTLIWLE